MRDRETTNPLVMLRRVRDRFIAGPAEQFATDTGEAIDLVQPDVVVPDYLIFGAIIAAQAAGVPVVPTVPNIWTLPSPGVPPSVRASRSPRAGPVGGATPPC